MAGGGGTVNVQPKSSLWEPRRVNNRTPWALALLIGASCF
jgi:hypothetical protein